MTLKKTPSFETKTTTDRRALMAGSLASVVAAVAVSDAGAAAASAAATRDVEDLLVPGGKAVRILRVHTGADGETRVDEMMVEPKTRDFFGAKDGLREYLRRKARTVSLFSAPPNVDLPLHNTERGEMFYMLTGSSTLILRDGTRYSIGAGDLVMMEDKGARGRLGKTGPEGYTALNIGYEIEP